MKTSSKQVPASSKQTPSTNPQLVKAQPRELRRRDKKAVAVTPQALVKAKNVAPPTKSNTTLAISVDHAPVTPDMKSNPNPEEPNSSKLKI